MRSTNNQIFIKLFLGAPNFILVNIWHRTKLQPNNTQVQCFSSRKRYITYKEGKTERKEQIQSVSKPMSQTFPGYSSPPLKQKRSYQHGSKSEQVPRYRLTFMCWYWVLHKMFKVLTICRNTSVETSHHGFPDAFQWNASGNPCLDQTLQLLKICDKGNLMNLWETFYIQQLACMDKRIPEQQPQEPNSLFALGSVPSQFAA
jgi:hypothetical protein